MYREVSWKEFMNKVGGKCKVQGESRWPKQVSLFSPSAKEDEWTVVFYASTIVW